jgi:superfamily II DNA/RNA helicase
VSLTFHELGIGGDLVDALAERGITSPTPIQAAAVADLVGGRDLVGRAPTGSGKTLAVGLPLLERVGRGGPGRPAALVLAPTRELAAQIHDTLAPLGALRRRRVLAVYGGVSLTPQTKALAHGVAVVVATPGRLEDLMAQRSIALDAIEVVVIDEADRLADMGFAPAVRRIVRATPASRQTALFSATLDDASESLTRDLLRNPIRVDVAGEAEGEPDLVHRFWTVTQQDRQAVAAQVVRAMGRTLVFTRTRHGADRVAKQLASAGLVTAALHGGHSQARRDEALAGFHAGRVQALVATDVASRGIHVDDVACVLQIDLPETPADHQHRSGRTGRAGAKGLVVTFVQEGKFTAARSMAKVLDYDVEIGPPALEELDVLAEQVRPVRPAGPVVPEPSDRPGAPVLSGLGPVPSEFWRHDVRPDGSSARRNGAVDPSDRRTGRARPPRAVRRRTRAGR